MAITRKTLDDAYDENGWDAMPDNYEQELYERAQQETKTLEDVIREWSKHGATSNNKKEADAYQVGGDHYKQHGVQPWDIITQYDLNFFAGNVVKYLLRYKYKNGVEDLEKAQHYLKKLIELERMGL